MVPRWLTLLALCGCFPDTSVPDGIHVFCDAEDECPPEYECDLLAKVCRTRVTEHVDKPKGAQWEELEIPGPPALAAAAVAYDAARGQVVLFGGRDPFLRDETWLFDGEAWTEGPSGPSAREDVAMAYDRARQRIVLFGGCDDAGAAQGDTWEWDGEWQEVQIAGPAPRCDHTMTYEPDGESIVLYGGWNGDEFFDDTWIYDGDDWLLWSDTFTPTSSFARLVFDERNEQLLLIDQNDVPAVYELSGVGWSLIEGSDVGPPARFGASVTYNRARGRVVMVGGLSTGLQTFGDTWEWDGDEWSETAHTGPPPADDAALVYDEAGGRIIRYGGSAVVTVLDATWAYTLYGNSCGDDDDCDVDGVCADNTCR